MILLPDTEQKKVYEAEYGTLIPVAVRDGSAGWPGNWFIHAQDLPLLDRIEAGDWQPRTTLLSPFDNLICDRQRTRLMFDFDFSIEIYVPADRRKYGYYALPILHGDRFIGRIDAAVVRKLNDFILRSIHSEDGTANRESGAAAAKTIADLAGYLGAKTVTPAGAVPSGWKTAFRSAF